MKLKSDCHRKNAFAILLTNFPFPPSPFPHASLSLFICPDLILCYSCELDWLILILLLEQCQSWQQGKQQRYMVKRSERKNGWRSWISLLPKMQPNQEPEGMAGHEGSKSQNYREGSKSAVPVSAEDAVVWGAPRESLFSQPGYLYTGSSQCESKELPIIHFHVLGSFGVSSSTFQSCCTECSKSHRRKGWCVAVGSICDLSI